ncbi:MAG TPA: sigma-70 family RNA polymerase sigma factor, partial [Candidatus Acidoferrum sp.]|nr:sigma-70 family RNA polymerase sigma factor [Candidatus Acidoferrum sp.]
MQELDDIALLRQFAAQRSEAAFDQLVSRHAGLVHSAALRQVRDPQWAAEITQAVFLILARKAARISDKTILTGWLFKTTRFVALAQVRSEAKRRQHEQETQMQTRLQTEPSSDAGDQAWKELAPLLDQALAQLNETDRHAVLLRFFENKSLAEVGNKLGAGEDTARKRISRALEKLRKFFAKHRVFYSTAIIAGAISAKAVQAAPPGLVAAIPAMALKGSAISVSTLALVKEALNLMTIAKLQTAALVAAAALLATGGTVVVNRAFAQENQTLRRQTAQSGPLPAVQQLVSNVAVQTGAQTSLSEQEVRELARLRDEVGRLRIEDARLRRLSNFLAKAQSTTNPPGIGESVWFISSSNELAALPPAFILRPTHFASTGGRGGGGGALSGGSGGEIGEGPFFGRWAASAGGNGTIPILARNISLAQLLAKAFAVDLNRVVSPPDAPTDGFDLLMTGPDATKEKLQAEIKSRLGYVAHIESRPTDILLLTPSQAGATGLLPATPSQTDATGLVPATAAAGAGGGGSGGGGGGGGGG